MLDKNLLVISLLTLVICLPIKSQVDFDRYESITFETHRILITDSLFLSQIDSLVIQTDCPNFKNENNKYFNLRFIYDSYYYNNDSIIQFELNDTPVGSSSDAGYFTLNGYTFFVSGNMPKHLYRTCNAKKQKFTFKRRIYAITEDSPMWTFSYEGGKLSLLLMDCW